MPLIGVNWTEEQIIRDMKRVWRNNINAMRIYRETGNRRMFNRHANSIARIKFGYAVAIEEKRKSAASVPAGWSATPLDLI